MVKSVLVPLDGSLLAEAALQPASRLVRESAGTLWLLRVPAFANQAADLSPDFSQALPQDGAPPDYDDAAAYLSETRALLAQQGINTRTLLLEGDQAEAIVETAVSHSIDVIVMGTHARSGISRWLMGSVGSKVMRRAGTPVLLVRGRSRFEHFLVALDGSKRAEEVLDSAVVLAQIFDCRLTLLHVTSSIGSRTEYEAYLNTIRQRCESADVEATAVVVSGEVAESILSFAAQEHVDLIAMCTDGRSTFRKMMFGSLTEKVLCNSGCAMLVIRPEQLGN